MLSRLWRVPLRMRPEMLVHHWRMGSQPGGPPNADGVVREASSEIVVGPSFSAKLANVGHRRPRMLNQLVQGSYVLLHEWDHPSADTMAS